MTTVLETIQGGSRYLEKRGIENARLNMEHLLAHVMRCKRMALYLDFDKSLDEDVLVPAREALRKRGEGVPLQHLLGTVDFRGHLLKVDARALIPRPETEELVDHALGLLGGMSGEALRFLDMGTGTGAIGLSVALEMAAGKVGEIVLADASPDALALAGENLESLQLPEGVSVGRVETDLFSAVDGRFHLIAANLPYIADAEVPTLGREVGHDPVLALAGGATGTEIMERFIDAARAHLDPGGAVLMEIGAGQAAELLKRLRAAGFREARAERDVGGIERFLVARA